MHINPAGIEPYTTTYAQWLGFHNLTQSQQAAVEPSGNILAPLRHRDINMGQMHHCVFAQRPGSPTAA
jgi:hypothetical protein